MTSSDQIYWRGEEEKKVLIKYTEGCFRVESKKELVDSPVL